MRKIFLIFVLFLLPLQYTWAMVANYDTHNARDSQAHFGHHEHPSSENHCNATDLAGNNKGDITTQAAKCHVHCGFLHLSCLELLSYDLPSFNHETNEYLNQDIFNHHPSPTYQPERPNWLAAV